MPSRLKQQRKAAKRVAHLEAKDIVCRYCGEPSAGGTWKGYAHKYGPRPHLFMAKPRE